ncbi:TonB-dependent receptor [Mucilaginibacter flavus]|uniref:TonB-dependent receptor n=1 Tax=Mucilaginibacter flavus TaxID=931504 RepID=UPI0025B406BF|nr:carboxypeptidase-like regulatory domain-containing protein [Mucilaginibacter flavus]MDN3584572.1 TonB-dependent receptor [Mucilaginibacter flavus]
MTKKIFFTLCFGIISFILKAQNGVITGRVTNLLTNKALSGVTVLVSGTTTGTTTDSTGNYQIKGLKTGFYNLEFSLVGYVKKITYDLQVTNATAAVNDIALEDDNKQLGEVRISASSQRDKTLESPVSLHTIGSTEIKRNPGGNRDISRAIQSLPGVSAPVGFRNDIIIRGGSPNENRFYIDGIEIPNINHFATQGASGGPAGLINIDFIKEVDFYSGAFPADRGNALSSVFEFKLKDGPTDKNHETFTLGSSDLAATFETPIGNKTTFISSYRYSYIQDFFKLIGLPVLPSYQDFQFKLKTKFDAKNELTFIGVGALDRFNLNYAAGTTEENRYELQTIPINSQNDYTFGATYKHYRSNGYSLLVLSRNYLDNHAYKNIDNDPAKGRSLDYSSIEAENKVRFENISSTNGYRLNLGVGAETSNYSTNTFNLLPFGSNIYASKLNFVRYNFFGQLSKSYFDEKLSLSAGLRADGNTYTAHMNDPLKTFSPRFSAAYNLTNQLSINFNTGIYYQLPSYTVLGYRDSTGVLVNQKVEYISSKQVVLGLEYRTLKNTRFTLEGFYKYYQKYPLERILGDTIPLANLGADFGVVGNQPVVKLGDGRSYGVELFAQQRLNKGFYGLFALTLFRSEFQDKNGNYVQSSWNNRYILSMTAGKILKRNWEVGAKLRLTGGSPYTPDNLAASSLISNYNLEPRAIPDYNLLNSKTLTSFYQADIRVDKKYYFKKYTLNLYLDIQNLSNNQYQLQDNLVPDRDTNGNLQPLPGDPSRFKTKFLKNTGGNILPSLGIIVAL